MEKIILKKNKKTKKPRRAAVIVSPETYIKVFALAHEMEMSIESLVDLLLTETLKAVEIQEG